MSQFTDLFDADDDIWNDPSLLQYSQPASSNTKKRKLSDLDKSQTSEQDELKEPPLKKQKIDVDDHSLSFRLNKNDKIFNISEKCVLAIVALELSDKQPVINVMDLFEQIAKGSFILTKEEFKQKQQSLNKLWQNIIEKVKDISSHIYNEWERRIISCESSFVHEQWKRGPKQNNPRARNTTFLSDLLKIIEICGINTAMNKMRMLIIHWMTDYGVTEDALKIGIKELIDTMDKDMDILFNADSFKDKSLPPAANTLFDLKQYSKSIACVMMMKRKNEFVVEELIQCSKWLCRRRGYPKHCGFELIFFNDGTVIVKQTQDVTVKYEIKENKSYSGAYANNPSYLMIDHPKLKSDTFWCFGRDDNWIPEFCQCWKHETDFVISAAQ